jgi:hypothetical protein
MPTIILELLKVSRLIYYIDACQTESNNLYSSPAVH